MRTAELITLLRGQDRSHPKTREILGTIEHARQLHILGELSNWLYSEIQKYKDRQLDQSALESPQQGSIRRQIRHTLLAIQVLIDNIGSNPELHTHGSTDAPKSVVFDEKIKDKVMTAFLRSILVGIVPLSPQADSTDVQLLCAKVLCYCTSPSNNGIPFDPQVLVRKMMTLTDNPIRQQGQATSSNQQRINSTSIAVSGITALLHSPMIKLQEYGLKILTAHKFIVQLDQSWELLIPLKATLGTLKDNIKSIATDQHVELFGQDLGVINANLELKEGDVHNNSVGGVVKELEKRITIRLKALTLLQWFLQEAGKFSAISVGSSATPSNTQDRLSASTNHININKKLEFLKEAVDVELLTDLWKAIQDVVLFDKEKLAVISERLVLLSTASIYWLSWIFQGSALNYIMLNAADTLMAWYGYYIVSHCQPLESAAKPALTPKETAQEQMELKHKSSIVEYLSKMIQNIVTSKTHQLDLFAGNPPIGIVILRRTTEFLEGIIESGQVGIGINSADYGQDVVSGENPKVIETNPTAYPMTIIQEKPGVLEAMLSIVTNCYGYSQEGKNIVLDSHLLGLLLLLLTDIKNVFSIQNLSESTSRKIRQLSLSMMNLIMKRDDHVPGIDDIPLTHWTLGYQAIVDMVLLPLETELTVVLEQNIDMTAIRETRSRSPGEEDGMKALKLYIQFWRHHHKGRNILSDLLAPRLHRLEMIPIIIEDQKDSGKWKRDRALLLLETIVHFGEESSVRINMRERWSSLPFIVGTLGYCVKRLESNNFSHSDTLSRSIAKSCLLAMKNFRFDRLGLVQMIELNIRHSDQSLWDDMMPSSIQPKRHSESIPMPPSPSLSSSSPSVVPLLLTIISPPETDWSNGSMIFYSRSKEGSGQRLRHPLFDERDQILVESAVMLSLLSQFPECQERLVSKPGVIWMLSRMMVERSLVSCLEQHDSTEASIAEPEEAPFELLEKALFDLLTKITSSEKQAKSLVSNNTMTELFAAIMETDYPMYFYGAKYVIEARAVDIDAIDLKGDTSETQILPSLHQYTLHQRILQHFKTYMAPIRGQFERIYQYIGGHRSTQEIDDTTETFYWLREYCALVFSYILDPPNSNSTLIWGSKVDRNAILDSESIFGVVCKMMTLEMEYDDADIQGDLTEEREELVKAQREDALRRRFSSGLAIQSLCWKYAEEWQLQHLELVRSYATVTSEEWEAYVSMLRDGGADSSTKNLNDSIGGGKTAVDFIVQDRVISFPDRATLSRTSIYFHALLMGDFKEASQKNIEIQDVEPDDFELLIEVIKESQFTARHILPDDLPLALVIRLLVCADKYMVAFVKRLAEAWILRVLGARELRYYETRSSDSQGKNSTKHPHDSISSDESPEKKRKLDGENNIDKVSNTEAEKVISDEGAETIQESLIMVFEVCSDPRYGNIYSTSHPFFGIVWDVLRRMALRLGSIASTPRFITMLNDGGEERIQELLMVIYDLIVNSIPIIN